MAEKNYPIEVSLSCFLHAATVGGRGVCVVQTSTDARSACKTAPVGTTRPTSRSKRLRRRAFLACAVVHPSTLRLQAALGSGGFPLQAHLSYKCYACASESEPSMGVFRFMPTEISSEIVISLYEGLFWNCNKIVISLLTLQNADGIKADDQLLNF